MLIYLLGWIIAGALVMATLLVHYEVILAISDRILPWVQKRHAGRRAMVLIVAALIGGHIIEIWVFALAMKAVAMFPALGSLAGDFDASLGAFGYFSAVNYTSLGYGDIIPHGAFAAIAVAEALTGLLMIAWSASFTYIKMEQIWTARRGGKV
ncbi:MAG: two pore domain potassium channel family protein [Alphaproteobacteria bacterium]|nr:two pore domain potassium channel family protein [Alphaproteobacteria bacterium]